MAERAISQENFGAWLCGDHFDSCSVVKSYRTAMMERGQTAFLWAGRGYRSVPSGVIAAGTITDVPDDGTGDEHWKHPSERKAIRLFAALDLTLNSAPGDSRGVPGGSGALSGRDHPTAAVQQSDVSDQARSRRTGPIHPRHE